MMGSDTSASSSSNSKFSFSLSKTKTISTNGNKRKEQEETVDYITDITGNKITSVVPEKADGPKVIPLSMQLPSYKKHKSNNSTTSSTSTTTTTTTTTSSSIITEKVLSLDEIAAAQVVKDVMERRETGQTDQTRIVPLCMQNQVEGIEEITDEALRFKHDVNNRPDDPSMEAYDDMPIESFGEAMMRGMGWCPGGLIGMNSRGLAEPIEFVKRAGNRLGLGATPKELLIPPSNTNDDDDGKKKKIIKPGESRDPKPVMVAKPGPDGKTRHIKAIGEALVPLVLGLSPGQLVYIVKGRHEGLSGTVIKLKKQWKEKGHSYDDVNNNTKLDDVYIRLRPSEEEVIVPSDHVSTSKPTSRSSSSRNVDDDDGDDDVVMLDSSSKSKSGSKSSSKSSKSSSSSSSSSSWLRSNIRVRVVSKNYDDGKYYNKKGTIVDVTGDKICIVQIDDGPLLDNLKQRNLETVVPPANGKIMVVSGKKSKGRTGTLLSKQKEEATVQLTGDLSVTTFSLDDIAQFVGDVDDDDY